MPRKLKISEKGQSTIELTLVAIIVLIVACTLILVAVEIAHPFVEAGSCREFDGVLLKTYPEEGNLVFEIQDNEGNVEIYVNNDNWFVGKTDSRINLVDIVDGDNYHFKVCGKRWPLMSWSPNLISKQRISQ